MAPDYFSWIEQRQCQSKPIEGDVVELDSILVLEGEAAEDSILRFLGKTLEEA